MCLVAVDASTYIRARPRAICSAGDASKQHVLQQSTTAKWSPSSADEGNRLSHDCLAFHMRSCTHIYLRDHTMWKDKCSAHILGNMLIWTYANSNLLPPSVH
jgi:hypothetical protein